MSSMHPAFKAAVKKIKHTEKHPGFSAVASRISKKEGVSKEAAGAILANATRKASAKAKRANKNLNRVK